MSARGELYIDELCRDVFQDKLDEAFGKGNWQLDGSEYGGTWDLTTLPDEMEVKILGSEDGETILGIAVITNRFYVEDNGRGKYIEVEPETIKIKKGEKK